MLDIFEEVLNLKFSNEKTKKAIIDSIPGSKIIDILLFCPKYYKIYTKSEKNSITQFLEGELVRCELKILSVENKKRRSGGGFVVIKCSDSTGGFIDVVFFKIAYNFLIRLKPETKFICTGKIEPYSGKKSLIHPKVSFSFSNEESSDFEVIQTIYPRAKIKEDLDIVRIEPHYGVKNTILQINYRKFLKYLIENISDETKNQINEINKDLLFPSLFESIERMHFPESKDDISVESKIFKRIAFEELLSSIISLNKIRNQEEKDGFSFTNDDKLIDDIKAKIGFELTSCQNNTISDILKDQENKKRMSRLVQGDVGSGKTIVAIISAINTVKAGYKVMVMAPTSILAAQHYESFKSICSKFNIGIELMTGSTGKKSRKDIEQNVRMGFSDIIIGTHALLYTKIDFSKFGLFIIDEQHQFGVEQRYNFSNKNNKADALMLTATPIPRSLLLTIYGDIDLSVIRTKPANRKQIETKMISIEKYDEIIKSIKRFIKQGNRVYWVCKLVERDEESDMKLMDVKTRFEALNGDLPGIKIGFVHGKMKSVEKDEVLNSFKSGKIDVLVATTVIEVGINVPEANLIVIENANSFGLSQLHQLRGRVGRGDKQSYCLLLFDSVSDTGKKRLEVLRNSVDGFEISEKDLELRGGGDMIGNHQSGLDIFDFFSLSLDRDIINSVNKLAKDMIENEDEENLKKIDILFKIFQKDKLKDGINLI